MRYDDEAISWPLTSAAKRLLKRAMQDFRDEECPQGMIPAELARRTRQKPQLIGQILDPNGLKNSEKLPLLAGALRIPMYRLLPFSDMQTRWLDVLDKLQRVAPDQVMPTTTELERRATLEEKASVHAETSSVASTRSARRQLHDPKHGE